MLTVIVGPFPAAMDWRLPSAAFFGEILKLEDFGMLFVCIFASFLIGEKFWNEIDGLDKLMNVFFSGFCS